jgi:transcriptional regulator with XRE-family HTH domain
MDVMNEESVGKNINNIRKHKNITLQDLARRSGLTKSYLSRIERSRKAPPYATVNRIAMALEVEVAYLISEKVEGLSDIRISIAKKNKGLAVHTLGSSYGYNYEALGFSKPGKNMQPYIITAAFDEKNIFQHEGEEFLYVLEGTYEFIYDGKKYIMEEGDSAYFDSGVPHTARSLGEKNARVLAVMYSYKRL